MDKSNTKARSKISKYFPGIHCPQMLSDPRLLGTVKGARSQGKVCLFITASAKIMAKTDKT